MPSWPRSTHGTRLQAGTVTTTCSTPPRASGCATIDVVPDTRVDEAALARPVAPGRSVDTTPPWTSQGPRRARDGLRRRGAPAAVRSHLATGLHAPQIEREPTSRSRRYEPRTRSWSPSPWRFATLGVAPTEVPESALPAAPGPPSGPPRRQESPDPTATERYARPPAVGIPRTARTSKSPWRTVVLSGVLAYSSVSVSVSVSAHVSGHEQRHQAAQHRHGPRSHVEDESRRDEDLADDGERQLGNDECRPGHDEVPTDDDDGRPSPQPTPVWRGRRPTLRQRPTDWEQPTPSRRSPTPI